METPAAIARSLGFTIQEALDVFAAQGKRADEARKAADATHAQLQRLLEPRPPGEPPDTSGVIQSIREHQTPEQVRQDHRADAALRVRWETAFCNIYQALMLLYAYPAAHRRADQIEAVIRNIRLLQVEDVDVAPPEFPDPSRLSGGDAPLGSAEAPSSAGFAPDRKREILRKMLGTTTPHQDRMRDAYVLRIDQTRSWLIQARELATALELELAHGPGQAE